MVLGQAWQSVGRRTVQCNTEPACLAACTFVTAWEDDVDQAAQAGRVAQLLQQRGAAVALQRLGQPAVHQRHHVQLRSTSANSGHASWHL